MFWYQQVHVRGNEILPCGDEFPNSFQTLSKNFRTTSKQF